jgi:hypothetical protein
VTITQRDSSFFYLLCNKRWFKIAQRRSLSAIYFPIEKIRAGKCFLSKLFLNVMNGAQESHLLVVACDAPEPGTGILLSSLPQKSSNLPFFRNRRPAYRQYVG